MRVERVEALGFGPFSGAELELAEGMTLVFGPNEAGKSSWHGALYAGVCGVRRGRGRRSVSDEEFEIRHRPWSGGPWQVRAVVALDDGRRFDLEQDLSARAGTALDHATGREVTRDILTDQTPDASRWLGLDRDAFRAVACVPQTALLQILEQPRQLANHLQRAAATAGTDATAAEAIRRIGDFLTENVGTDRAYTKPLAIAKAELRTARDTLGRAQEAHEGLARLREGLREASIAEETAELKLRCAEAAHAQHRADDAQNLWKQAADLSERYPEPPPSLSVSDDLAQHARVAVDGYRSRPAVAALDGPSAADLQAESKALPQAPSGDLKPSLEVERAYEDVRQARANLGSVVTLEPAVLTVPPVPADPGELRGLADALATPLPDAPAPTAPAEARRTIPGNRSLLTWVTAAVAVVLLLAGVAAAAAARQPLGWAAAAAGAVIGAVLIVRLLRDRTRQIAVLTDMQTTGTAWAVRQAAEQRLVNARDRAAELSLPTDPKTIRDLADAVDRARVAGQQHADWERSRDAAGARLDQALLDLTVQLRARSVPVTSDPENDFHRYRDECGEREQQATLAARRDDLEARIRHRQQAEAQAADAKERRSRAEHAVRAAARDCHIPDSETGDLETLTAALEAWLSRRQQELSQHEQAAGDYAVLENLLEGGRTVEGLRQEAERLATAADAAAADLDPEEVAAADLGADPIEALQALQREAQGAREQLIELQTASRDREQGAPSVAASQEAVSRAEARVAHLEHLGRILISARDFLVRAQDNVHRSIAPELADAIGPHLATVTGGRYTEARVDPDDLQVRVRPPSGTWREAARHSHGTAEQVYLLLRAALAQYLATTGEACPLILDDPTAYADAARTDAVLQVLHNISAERQVIVFSHDPQVLAWAQQHLVSARDKLVELDGEVPA